MFNKNVLIPIKISLKLFAQESNYQHSRMHSDNSLAPVSRQAIIWTNDGLFIDAYMSLDLNELIVWSQPKRPSPSRISLALLLYSNLKMGLWKFIRYLRKISDSTKFLCTVFWPVR